MNKDQEAGQFFLCGLPIERLGEAEPYIKEALLDDGRLPLDTLLELIEKGEAQVWAVHNGQKNEKGAMAIHAIATTQVVQHPRLKTVRIQTLAGSGMREWIDVLIETLGAWGKEYGAQAIEFCGRIGWERVLEKRGFTEPRVFMTRPI